MDTGGCRQKDTTGGRATGKKWESRKIQILTREHGPPGDFTGLCAGLSGSRHVRPIVYTPKLREAKMLAARQQTRSTLCGQWIKFRMHRLHRQKHGTVFFASARCYCIGEVLCCM